MADTNTFGAFLRSMRKQLDITQEVAASKAGISGSYLAQLESGKRNPPSAEIVRRISHAYAVDESLMLNRAGYGESPKTQIAPERIEWAFNAMCTDPAFKYGHAIHHRPFDLDTKAFLVEMYCYCTGRMLLVEGVMEVAELNDAAGVVNPLESRLEAVSNHLESQIRNLLREWTLKTPASQTTGGGVPVGASSAAIKTPDELPVRNIKMKGKAATVSVADSPAKPSAARKIRMKRE